MLLQLIYGNFLSTTACAVCRKFQIAHNNQIAQRPISVDTRWRRGVAVECRIFDREVAGSSLDRALRRKNSGQVSHVYVPLSPSSITWYWPEGGDA